MIFVSVKVTDDHVDVGTSTPICVRQREDDNVGTMKPFLVASKLEPGVVRALENETGLTDEMIAFVITLKASSAPVCIVNTHY